VRIRIEILKTTKVVVVQQRGYVERWKCWLNHVWWFSLDTEPSLTWQYGVVDNQEFLGNSGTTWNVPRDPTSRSFSANNRRHQLQITGWWMMTTEDWIIWIDDSHQWRFQAYAYACLL